MMGTMREGQEPRFFRRAQRARPPRSAPYVWPGTKSARLASVGQRPSGPEAPPFVSETPAAGSSREKGLPSASSGRKPPAARPPIPNTSISVPDAGATTTELQLAVEHRRTSPCTPYKADVWESKLAASRLDRRYPLLVHSLRTGFTIGMPRFRVTRTPDNSPSIRQQADTLDGIIRNEQLKGRYLGPFTQAELEALIGPFQSSPISLVPKPHKPDVFRLVQNFSYPHSAKGDYSSVNSALRSDDFPCTWGTFTAMALLCARLPPGSQAAVRDVAEAYRTIPLHHSQWPGTVIKTALRDQYLLDSNAAFGAAPNAGLYGGVADAGADLMRAEGIGPISKWVDDHVFFRILRCYIDEYNRSRAQWRAQIEYHGGRHQDGGRLWFGGDRLEDGRVDEFVEDMGFPVRDLSLASARSPEEALFSCCLADVDRVSLELGIPWQVEKDRPFAAEFTFTGLTWNLDTQRVSLPPAKASKYRDAITNWRHKRAHTLAEVQKLYGKLLHASLVLPEGRAYLTSLESMLGIFHDNPFMPRTPPRLTPGDLDWWFEVLSSPLSRPIPGPSPVSVVDAFSDASSGTGIAVVIGPQWRAWILRPGWNSDGRDIQWAEAVGFELLTLSLLAIASLPPRIRVFGDNTAVVDGWRNGRSRNQFVNLVFRRIHTALADSHTEVFASYVASGDNPADGPSRGHYPGGPLLAPLALPGDLSHFLSDIVLEGPGAELHAEFQAQHGRPKPPREGRRSDGPGDGIDWRLVQWDD